MKYTNKQIDERIYHLVLRIETEKKRLDKLQAQVSELCKVVCRIMTILEKTSSKD